LLGSLQGFLLLLRLGLLRVLELLHPLLEGKSIALGLLACVAFGLEGGLARIAETGVGIVGLVRSVVLVLLVSVALVLLVLLLLVSHRGRPPMPASHRR
jgi:hypothetical protein